MGDLAHRLSYGLRGLTEVTGDTGDADFRKSYMKTIYMKVTKNSVTICHLSPTRVNGLNGKESVAAPCKT
jgi:hypothetical protein